MFYIFKRFLSTFSTPEDRISLVFKGKKHAPEVNCASLGSILAYVIQVCEDNNKVICLTTKYLIIKVQVF